MNMFEFKVPPLLLIGMLHVVYAAAEKTSPEALAGERLFRESRFAQRYASMSNGDANMKLADREAMESADGDYEGAELALSLTTTSPVRGAFAGQTMASCRALPRGSTNTRRRLRPTFLLAISLLARQFLSGTDGRILTSRNTPTLCRCRAPGSEKRAAPRRR